MGRRGYGLHRLAGGIAKREREAWERIERGATCHALRCPVTATVLIQNAQGMLYPACEAHAAQGRKMGYTAIEPPKSVSVFPNTETPSRGQLDSSKDSSEDSDG